MKNILIKEQFDAFNEIYEYLNIELNDIDFISHIDKVKTNIWSVIIHKKEYDKFKINSNLRNILIEYIKRFNQEDRIVDLTTTYMEDLSIKSEKILYYDNSDHLIGRSLSNDLIYIQMKIY
jgi:hypothetical protein